MPALLSEVGQINVKKGKLEPDKHYILLQQPSAASNHQTPQRHIVALPAPKSSHLD
jgi:hypothetical protein